MNTPTKNLGIIFVLVLLNLPNPIFGNAVLDSLKRTLPSLSSDTLRVDLMLDISKKTYRSDPDSTILYANRAYTLAEKIGYGQGRGYALKNLGLVSYAKGDFPQVLDYWTRSLDVFRSINFKLGESNLLNNLGAVYFSKGDDPHALTNYLGSLRIAEELGDQKRIATAYMNMGAVYVNEASTYELALDSYKKAFDIFIEMDNKDGIGTTSMNIGEVYTKMNKHDLAEKHLIEAIPYLEEAGSTVATAYHFLGNTYESKKEYRKAIEYQRKAIAASKKQDSKMELSKARIGHGNALIKNGQSNLAIENFKQALELAAVTEVKTDMRDAYEGLAIAYSQKGDFKSAFKNQRLYDKFKDTVKNDEYDDTMGNLRFQFDLENKEKEIEILEKDNAIKKEKIKQSSIVQKFLYALAGLLLVIIGGVTFQYRFIKKSNKLIEAERNRSESILLNILPEETANELKDKGYVEARKFKETTVLFTDFKAFSVIAETITPEHLVKSVDYYFKKFDAIIDKHNLEKIKTIGDAYMCAGGLPTPNTTNAEDAFNAAIDMVNFVKETKANPPDGVQPFDIRIGLNTGPVVAGVVGTKKFQYDIWGATVNTAARMESSSEPNKINVSENTYMLLKHKADFIYRGEIEIKNNQKMKMYFVNESSIADVHLN